MDMINNYWYTSNKEKIEKYKYLIMLGLDRASLDELSKGDKYMEEYTKRVEELNDNGAFTSWITAEEDERLILNTEKRISYNEGKDDRNIEIAKVLLKTDVSMELISETTGLSMEQLNQLKES